MSTAAPHEPGPSTNVPATLKLAGILTLIEGLGVLVVTGWLLVGIVREPPSEPATAWFAMLLLGLFGVGVVVVGRGVGRAARWSRAPAAVTQLLVLAIGSQLATVAAVTTLVAISVVTGVLLFLPPSTAAFVPPTADAVPDGADTDTDADQSERADESERADQASAPADQASAPADPAAAPPSATAPSAAAATAGRPGPSKRTSGRRPKGKRPGGRI